MSWTLSCSINAVELWNRAFLSYMKVKLLHTNAVKEFNAPEAEGMSCPHTFSILKH